VASTFANQRSVDRKSHPQSWVGSNEVLSEEAFHRMISLERQRSERTQRPFVLLLMDTGRTLPTEKNGRVLLDILSALQAATRETDVMGWHDTNSIVGVMFIELTLENNLILSTILSRISDVLRDRLTTEQFSQIKFSFHLFPEQWDPNNPERQSNPTLYPDLNKHDGTNRFGRTIKRGMDILGSLLLLVSGPGGSRQDVSLAFTASSSIRRECAGFCCGARGNQRGRLLDGQPSAPFRWWWQRKTSKQPSSVSIANSNWAAHRIA
jgi:hypothetical protein